MSAGRPRRRRTAPGRRREQRFRRIRRAEQRHAGAELHVVRAAEDVERAAPSPRRPARCSPAAAAPARDARDRRVPPPARRCRNAAPSGCAPARGAAGRRTTSNACASARRATRLPPGHHGRLGAQEAVEVVGIVHAAQPTPSRPCPAAATSRREEDPTHALQHPPPGGAGPARAPRPAGAGAERLPPGPHRHRLPAGRVVRCVARLYAEGLRGTYAPQIVVEGRVGAAGGSRWTM